MENKYNIAVIGATGNVGKEILNIIDEEQFPAGNVTAIASKNSKHKQVSFGDKTLDIMTIDEINFDEVDIAFFCTSEDVSREYAVKAADAGAIVIDKSSYFRMHDNVPLIVPEVNGHLLKGFKSGIIASPNCCTIPLAVALKPLDNAAKIKRIVVSTYQSVSGAGKKAMDELYIQTKAKFIFEDIPATVFPKQMAFNLFPHIGDFRKDNYTSEEHKISSEITKIIGNHAKSTISCIRVPVFVSHSMSVNVEFEQSLNAKEAEEILSEADGVIVFQSDNEEKYVCPVDATGNDAVFVSRIRDDASAMNSLNMWVVSDNLRKGAALNAVQIAQEVVNNK